MIDPHQNEVELLSELIFALEMSQGNFRLFLASCNYQTQRQRLMEKLQTSFSGDLAKLEVDASVEKLYTTIGQHLGDQQPDGLMVWGLESNRNIDKLLVSMGLVREECKNNCHFPIVLWIDQEISPKFIRLIPDFESWTSLTVFDTTTQELRDFIQQTRDSVYQKVLESGAEIFLDYTDQGLPESTYQELLDPRQKLATVANRAIEVLDTSQPSFRLARAYDFLAECELAKGNYKQGKKLAETAIEIFDNTLSAASVPASEKDKKTLEREKDGALSKREKLKKRSPPTKKQKKSTPPKFLLLIGIHFVGMAVLIKKLLMLCSPVKKQLP